MMAYDLPTSLTIGGVEHPIRYNWRAILDILFACADPDLNDECKALCLLQIFYPEWEKIPDADLQEACMKACEFIDCGQKDDGKPKPKMIDWEQDAPIIIPEINKVAGREVRLDPNIHWWTFFGWFMGIGDGLLASVLHIRKKKAQRKKLEKWEEEFYRANKSLVDITHPETAEARAEKEELMKWL
ncbi:MAG: hypothetical protein J6Q92_05250 [Oscillospiraceae bacterium]|nr:hypothetical protein [Oscillospiraceae bacterium]